MVVVVGFYLLIWLTFRDPDPPAEAKFQPMPPGVVIKSNDAGCDHETQISELWCSRTLVVAKAGTSSHDLIPQLASWYASKPAMSVPRDPAHDPPNPYFGMTPVNDTDVRMVFNENHPGLG